MKTMAGLQNPGINGYSGAFGYKLSNGVTIVIEATKSETATTDASPSTFSARSSSDVTPATPINFRAPQRRSMFDLSTFWSPSTA